MRAIGEDYPNIVRQYALRLPDSELNRPNNELDRAQDQIILLGRLRYRSFP